jgi:ATP-binding cassette subfamily B (MDR/TAP) protein 1
LMSARALGMSTAVAPDISKGQHASNVIFQILDRKSKINAYPAQGELAGKRLDSVEGRIKLNEIDFSFPTRPDAHVLSNLTLTANPGSTVALVGKSGSGKTASLLLIERFYEPDRGNVTLDGVNINELNLYFLRSEIGIHYPRTNIV